MVFLTFGAIAPSSIIGFWLSWTTRVINGQCLSEIGTNETLLLLLKGLISTCRSVICQLECLATLVFLCHDIRSFSRIDFLAIARPPRLSGTWNKTLFPTLSPPNVAGLNLEFFARSHHLSVQPRFWDEQLPALFDLPVRTYRRISFTDDFRLLGRAPFDVCSHSVEFLSSLKMKALCFRIDLVTCTWAIILV